MKMYDIFGTREIKQQTKNYSMTIWKQSDDLMNNFKEFLNENLHDIRLSNVSVGSRVVGWTREILLPIYKS